MNGEPRIIKKGSPVGANIILIGDVDEDAVTQDEIECDRREDHERWVYAGRPWR